MRGWKRGDADAKYMVVLQYSKIAGYFNMAGFGVTRRGPCTALPALSGLYAKCLLCKSIDLDNMKLFGGFVTGN